jgi:alkanesulfonate monooxygenase SsuD/methylene tetrahydromethanopterin reductase-like flavin-dependent oxidoreductase (luciferase family)
MPQAAAGMRDYLAELRGLLPEDLPLYVAALGPRMLRLGGEYADGVLLNWCSAEQAGWSRGAVEEAARAAHRSTPVIASYIRTSVDPDPDLARTTLAGAALQYALGPPAYRRHFERMGFTEELHRLEAKGGDPSPQFLATAGAAGAPGEVRRHFEHLAEPLDIAIVRVLVTDPGDPESALRTLQEIRPSPLRGA